MYSSGYGFNGEVVGIGSWNHLRWKKQNKWICSPLCAITPTRSTNKQIARDKGWLRKSSSLANASTESSDHRGFLLFVLDSSSGGKLMPKVLGPPGFHMYFNSFSQPPCRKPYCWTLRKEGVLFCLDVWVAMEKDKEAFWEDTDERLITQSVQRRNTSCIYLTDCSTVKRPSVITDTRKQNKSRPVWASNILKHMTLPISLASLW